MDERSIGEHVNNVLFADTPPPGELRSHVEDGSLEPGRARAFAKKGESHDTILASGLLPLSGYLLDCAVTAADDVTATLYGVSGLAAGFLGVCEVFESFSYRSVEEYTMYDR